MVVRGQQGACGGLAQGRRLLARPCCRSEATGGSLRGVAWKKHSSVDDMKMRVGLRLPTKRCAAHADVDTQTSSGSVQEHLEKLYTLDNGAMNGTSSQTAAIDSAMQDVDALLEDLQMLDEELESALVSARGEGSTKATIAGGVKEDAKATSTTMVHRSTPGEGQTVVVKSNVLEIQSEKVSSRGAWTLETRKSSSSSSSSTRVKGQRSSRGSRLKRWGAISDVRGASKQEKLTPEKEAELARDNPEEFLASINRHHLLTAEQEKQLAGFVQRRVELEDTAKELAKSLKRLPSEGEWAHKAGLEPEALRQELWRGQQAREHMIACNMRLVVSIAKRYVGRGMALQDLVAEGVQGLKRSVDKFDPSKGFKFSTYAHWWIRQAVTRSISDQGRVVRLPVHLHEQLARVRKVEEELCESLGRTPTAEEVAAHSSLSFKKLAALYKTFRTPTSYETPNPADAEDGRNQTDEYIVDESVEDPFVYAARKMLQLELDEVLNTLEPREANIIRLRYGLVDGRECTLEEVGQVHDLTRERIRQLEVKTIKKLKSPSRIQHFSSQNV